MSSNSRTFPRRLGRWAPLLLALLLATPALAAPGDRSTDGVWTELGGPGVNAALPSFLVAGAAYRTLALDDARLRAILDAAPREFLPGARDAAPTLTLPLPRGGWARFRVLESPILEGKLALDRPDITTFIAQGVDDPTATARLDRTPAGFHAQVKSPDGLVYVDPITAGSPTYHVFDARDRAVPDVPFVCEVGTGEGNFLQMPEGGIDPGGSVLGLQGADVLLRTYRLAVVTSGEYRNFFGGQTQAQNAVVTTINRVTGIYETEVAVRFNLTSTTIYNDPATDPFATPNDISTAQLDRVDSLLDAVVGVANYDIGH